MSMTKKALASGLLSSDETIDAFVKSEMRTKSNDVLKLGQ